MHPVLRGLLGLDRQERPRPDMQRQPMQRDAASAQRGFQRRREMQPCGRCRHRALIGGEHGLVVADVLVVRRAFGSDVGRQRRRADIGDRLVERRAVERE